MAASTGFSNLKNLSCYVLTYSYYFVFYTSCALPIFAEKITLHSFFYFINNFFKVFIRCSTSLDHTEFRQ